MNVLTFPGIKTVLTQNGHLRDEFFAFFSMNTQEQQLFFSQDGHLVPTRTSADLSALSTPQYTGRFAYNGTTNNHMANTAGIYKNLTMNQLSTRSQILAMTPLGNRIEFYGDENKNLYTNVNGTIFQNLMVAKTYPVNFSTDGTNLSVNVNGTTSDVVLTNTAIPIQFTSFDGTYLFLNIAGTPRKILTAAP
jgi:hypothetical protein